MRYNAVKIASWLRRQNVRLAIKIRKTLKTMYCNSGADLNQFFSINFASFYSWRTAVTCIQDKIAHITAVYV